MFGFAAVYFDGRLCDGTGAVMNERERMVCVGFIRDCGWPSWYGLMVGGANGIGDADIWFGVFRGW